MPGFGSLLPLLDESPTWLKSALQGSRAVGSTGVGFGSIAPAAAEDEQKLRDVADLPEQQPYYDPATGLQLSGGRGAKYQSPQSKKQPTYTMEPDLTQQQMGVGPEGGSDAPNPYPPGTEESDYFERSRTEGLPQVRRPGVLPVAKTPEGYTLAVPKAAELAQYIMGGPAIEAKAGEAVLGAGMARVKRAAAARAKVAEETPPPPIGHNQPPQNVQGQNVPPQNVQMDEFQPVRPETRTAQEIAYPPPPKPVGDRSKFVDAAGNAIEGAAYTKEARRILDEIAAGPKGAGPIDLTKPTTLPPVPQVDLPRYAPPRGVSPRLQDALNNPEVLDGLRQGIRNGMEMGAHNWYVNDAVRDAFVKELGPVKGQAEFERMMDNVAATSPRSDVPTNVRNASYYFAHATPADLPDKNPYPYGHIAQKLHRQNIETISSEGGWEPLQNPKPASFAQNLKGNYEPVTADTHAFRAIGMRTEDPRFLEPSVSAVYKAGGDPATDTLVGKYGEISKNKKGQDIVTFRPRQLFDSGKLTMEDAKKIPYFWATKPKENEYAAVEQLYKQLAAEHGLTPAGAQAAGWAGSGELTGLGTVPTHTFPELLNERILFTAKMRGENPATTLKNFIRGKKPLLSTALTAGTGAAGAAALSKPSEEERQ
jgi:hypothetical protein